jgi:sulfur carrier protein ThiS
MRIILKLYASLADFLPPAARETRRLELEVPADATIADVIRERNLPPKLCHLVLLNGFFIPPAARATRTFGQDDELAIWPPIAGG